MQDPLETSGPFGRLLGYRLTAWREGYVEIELTLGPQHLNRSGIPHGGLLATLVDAACGHAGCYSAVPGHRRWAMTVSLNTQFLGRARAGDLLTAAGWQTGGGRRIFFARCEVRDGGGRLVAQGEGAFRRGGESAEGEPAAER